MRHLFKSLTLAGSALTVAALTGCGNLPESSNRDLSKICKEYCREVASNEPKLTMMMNQTIVNGVRKTVPTRQIYIENSSGNLITPYDAAYGSLLGTPEGLQYPDKAEGLNPSCFAEDAYEPIALENVKLSKYNTTITLVNFTEGGRLESRELSVDSPYYAKISDAFAGNQPSNQQPYQYIQNILSTIDDTDIANMYSTSTVLDDRDLIANATPPRKTPFFKNLAGPNFTDGEGHVFFYVLLDDHLKFSRDYLSLITYAPQSGVKELFTPFVQHPITPQNATQGKRDVLTFQFFRDPGLKSEDVETCRYVYDMHVISTGQKYSGSGSASSRKEHSTPLFIDPEVQTRGVIIKN